MHPVKDRRFLMSKVHVHGYCYTVSTDILNESIVPDVYENTQHFLSELLEGTAYTTQHLDADRDECFLMYEPKFPWQMSSQEKEMQYPDIVRGMYKVISPFLKEEITYEKFESEVYYVDQPVNVYYHNLKSDEDLPF